MTTRPELPRFEIPVKRNATPPRLQVWDWMRDNLRRLGESGALQRIKGQASRRPVDRRFKL